MVIRKKEECGLSAINFSIFEKVLKITWVKRLRSDTNSTWKYIPFISSLSHVAGNFLFKCNYGVTPYV